MSSESELSRIKKLMAELEIRPNKNLGQNFLINEKVIEKIITFLDLKNKHIVEVGPGLGALTTKILNLTSHLFLIEYDQKIYNYWEQLGLKAEHVDALKYDWSQVDELYTILISNLPYDISSSLVIKLSMDQNPINEMLLMFQKEVAQRITASIDSKSYGLISVIAQNIWEIKKVADLKPSDFYPAPKIDSRILYFKRIKGVQVHKSFLSFVKHCFVNRRKMVVKNLNSYAKSKNLDSQIVSELMGKLAIDMKARPENISPQVYLKLFNDLNQYLG